MKFLAMERELPNADWANANDILSNEAKHVHKMQKAGILREIYFTEDKNAVLVLECNSKDEAESILNEFPLVVEKFIEFDVVALLPYTGLDRIINIK